MILSSAFGRFDFFIFVLFASFVLFVVKKSLRVRQ